MNYKAVVMEMLLKQEPVCFGNCKACVCASTFPAAAAWGSTWMVPCTIPGCDALTVPQAGTSCFTTSQARNWKF